MATTFQTISGIELTLTAEEREWLATQSANYSGRLNINIWEKYGQKRLYIQLSGGKEKVWFDLNDAGDLKVDGKPSFINAIVTFIEAQMPVDEEEVIETVVDDTVYEQTAERDNTPMTNEAYGNKAEIEASQEAEFEAIWSKIDDENQAYDDAVAVEFSPIEIPAQFNPEATRSTAELEKLEARFRAWAMKQINSQLRSFCAEITPTPEIATVIFNLISKFGEYSRENFSSDEKYMQVVSLDKGYVQAIESLDTEKFRTVWNKLSAYEAY